MKNIVVYHGSERLIEKPEFGYGNKHNDYGLCFYCAIDEELGKEWACKESNFGYLNTFSISIPDSTKILNLTDKTKYSVLNWIAILLKFRFLSDDFVKRNKRAFEFLSKYYIDVEQYDLIIGYRADDSYFAFPRAFIENKISLERLEEIYFLGELGIQYAFKTKPMFDLIKHLNSSEVGQEYHVRYVTRINNAKLKYEELLEICNEEKGTFMRDLVNKND